jgi:phosphoribosylformylglycinamidine synthase subunit PurL
VLKVFEKWDLPCSGIGEVTGDGLLRFYMHGVLEAELPAEELVLGGGAPQYTRPYSEPAYFSKIKAFDPGSIPVPANLRQVAEKLVSIPNIASKKAVYVQYDSMVGTGNTSTNAPSDAAVVLAKPTGKGLALTTDCNSRYVFADPYRGGMMAVAEAARNIVCSGGKPLGITNCLNFGNPYDPEVYYQFVHAIKGMGEACVKFDTPVTGGNVSFYNQNPEGPVYPTPTIGMVGLLERISDKMTLDFKNAGDLIFMLGRSRADLGSSEYLHKVHGVEYSPAPYFDLEEEFALQQKLSGLMAAGLVASAHDVSEGGLFVTLLESCFPRNLGMEVAAADRSIRPDAYWFGEAQGRIVVSVPENRLAAFRKAMEDFPHEELGRVAAGRISVEAADWGQVSDWKHIYDNAIDQLLAGHESEYALAAL